MQELKSLAKQIKEAYFTNLRAPNPFQLYLTGLETGSRIHNALNTHIKNFSTFKVEATHSVCVCVCISSQHTHNV